ncbi:inovirus-type Gp2 protein [Halomonas campisalis]|uniref:Inovirus-type Gp2 protein n=1 Tax=Billgrantia campisalis TaxID=74661 RepID=A0ABS9PDI4_9GAMM|nr:inovirus-type Gp2 protein [Halomonas campisalis]MCG6659836.1 inovirus-type Gp2 protein [Halomonas campisalis]MDR5865049.1 inovirus-type Gp2 protein [Halomonas campisalis]
MIDDGDNDILSEDDMLAICQGMNSTLLETSAWGQEIATLSHHLWRQDLIEADRQLKALAAHETLLQSEQLVLPDGYGSNVVVLAPDATLDTLTTLYTVLVTMFHETDIGRHYRPSPYAQRFLWAFASCAYLREAGFHQPPTMSWQVAEQTVVDLNQRLTSWYQCLKQPAFAYECSRNRRNSRNNYQRLRQLIDGLFTRHSRLTVLRVDLSYSESDASYIDYETARYHREQLCETFHRHELFHHLLGYAWKLEWRPKKGFHYHFLFFFNGHHIQEDITLARRIGEHWARHITGGQGHYYNCNRKAETVYHYNALGRIDYHDFEKQRGLDYIARYLTKTDEYASMLVIGRTFQTSSMPGTPAGPRPGRPRQLPAPATWCHDALSF